MLIKYDLEILNDWIVKDILDILEQRQEMIEFSSFFKNFLHAAGNVQKKKKKDTPILYNVHAEVHTQRYITYTSTCAHITVTVSVSMNKHTHTHTHTNRGYPVTLFPLLNALLFKVTIQHM